MERIIELKIVNKRKLFRLWMGCKLIQKSSRKKVKRWTKLFTIFLKKQLAHSRIRSKKSRKSLSN